MKAEERKELQTNSLVRLLGRLKHNFKGGPSRKATVIWGIVILALVVFVVWRIASSRSEANNSARWVAVDEFTALDLDRYAQSEPEGPVFEFVKKNSGTIQANESQREKAKKDLKDGLDNLYLNRDRASEQLKDAADAFEKLAKEFKATPIIVQECLLGAGYAYEGLAVIETDKEKFDANLKRALGFYEDLLGRFKDSEIAKQKAEPRARAIKENRQEFEELNDNLTGRSVDKKK
jgi:hypothetical protein